VEEEEGKEAVPLGVGEETLEGEMVMLGKELLVPPPHPPTPSMAATPEDPLTEEVAVGVNEFESVLETVPVSLALAAGVAVTVALSVEDGVPGARPPPPGPTPPAKMGPLGVSVEDIELVALLAGEGVRVVEMVRVGEMGAVPVGGAEEVGGAPPAEGKPVGVGLKGAERVAVRVREGVS